MHKEQAGRNAHKGQPVRYAGANLQTAKVAVVMIHGRGANAESILSLAPEIDVGDCAFVAPQAAGNTWYPLPFMMPLEQNEPFLSSALATVGDTLQRVAAAGLPLERTVLLGFSQGACLAIEYMARNAQRYGGGVGLSGGLIGPDGTSRAYPGSMAGTPIFLGCSDVDAHIPAARVRETAEIMRRLGAEVDERLYPGMGHTVIRDEIEAVRAILQRIAEQA